MTWKSASLLILTLTLGCGSSASPPAAQSAPPPIPPGVTCHRGQVDPNAGIH